MKENHSAIALFWKKSSRHIFIFLFYEWKSSLLSQFYWYMMMTLCSQDSRKENLCNNIWWLLLCQISLNLQSYHHQFIHLKSLLMFEAVYHALFQMFTLSDCKTCIVQSFASDCWISDFFSHDYCQFHIRAAQD